MRSKSTVLSISKKVRVLKEAMERGDESELLDDDGIRQAIDSLFGLPHFGQDLRAIFQNNERAAEMTYREKSFNVSAGSHWCKSWSVSHR